MNKLTYLDKLILIKNFIGGSEFDNDSVKDLREHVQKSIDTISNKITEEKLTNDLIKKIKDLLTGSYVKILDGDDEIYTKLETVNVKGTEHFFCIEYTYSCFVSTCRDNEGVACINYQFNVNSQVCPYAKQFDYSGDVEKRVFDYFSIIKEKEFKKVVNKITNNLFKYINIKWTT